MNSNSITSPKVAAALFTQKGFMMWCQGIPVPKEEIRGN